MNEKTKNQAVPGINSNYLYCASTRDRLTSFIERENMADKLKEIDKRLTARGQYETVLSIENLRDMISFIEQTNGKADSNCGIFVFRKVAQSPCLIVTTHEARAIGSDKFVDLYHYKQSIR